MIKSKRGISPLIATVLLIGFTIAMAGFVTTFVIKQTKQNFNPEKFLEDSTLCDQMTLGLVVPDTSGLSMDTRSSSVNYLKGVSVQNKGAYAVRGLVLHIDGFSDDVYYLFDDDMAKKVGHDVMSNDYNLYLGLGSSGNQYYIAPGKDWGFGDNGIPVSKTKHKVKIYPIVKDFEKNEPAKCIKSVLEFDYCDVCKSYNVNTCGC